MKRSITSIMVVVALLLGAGSLEKTWAGFKGARFAVMSDLHYYDTRLGTTGAAFEKYLNEDRKMLRESGAILDAAIDEIIDEDVDFVLVSGDLTKDGELVCHLGVAKRLARLERKGIQVLVVPGNHDISNPHAVKYLGDKTVPVPNVSPCLFKLLYARYGYGQAMDRDRHSLSYLVEPVRGLWVLALDSCRYRDNAEAGSPVTGGRLTAGTLAWIEDKLAEAKRRHKTVIAFMHHGAVEHFSGQSVLFPDYLLDDWETVSRTLAENGLKVIFTGHFHAQDAVDSERLPQPIQPSIVDVETGSLVTYPSPYRIATIDAGKSLSIESRTVYPDDSEFQNYARAYTKEGLAILARVTLTSPPYSLTDIGVVELLAGLIAEAFLAHYAGDETPDEPTLSFIYGLLAEPEPQHTLGMYLGTLWTDWDRMDRSALLPLE